MSCKVTVISFFFSYLAASKSMMIGAEIKIMINSHTILLFVLSAPLYNVQSSTVKSYKYYGVIAKTIVVYCNYYC